MNAQQKTNKRPTIEQSNKENFHRCKVCLNLKKSSCGTCKSTVGLNFKPGQTVICDSLFEENNGVLYAFVLNNTKYIDHHRHNSITVTV